MLTADLGTLVDLIVPLMDFLSLHVFSNSAVAALSSVYLASFLSAPTLTELVVLQQSFRIPAKNQSRRLITKNIERRAGFLLLHNVFRGCFVFSCVSEWFRRSIGVSLNIFSVSL